jgi:2-methylaconitate cis-trans-isomerase PrpF
VLKVEGEGDFEVSLVDAGMAVVFIRAESLGLKGGETPQEIDANKKLLERIEKIRSVAAERLGLCTDRWEATKVVPYTPFFAIWPPMSYARAGQQGRKWPRILLI